MKQSYARLAPLALLFALAASYGGVVAELVRDWIRDPNYSHGFLIPPVSGYLLWRRRAELRTQPQSRTTPASRWGLAGILIALILLVVGTAAAEVFTQRISLGLLLISLVLYLHGWQTLRQVAFPLCFLFLAVPLPYLIYYGLTAPMQALAAKLAVWGLRAAGVQALAQGNIIHLADGSLGVSEACSGIRSLYAFLAVGALVAHATPIPVWGRIAVFLVTIPLSVAGNAVRVWGSGMGAYLIGPETTKGNTHELFGLLVFACSLGVFVIIKKATQRIWSIATSSPPWSSSSRDSTLRASAPREAPPERSLH